MASSVARMPREEWTSQTLFASSHTKHLKKLHVPKISIPSPKPDMSKEAEPEVLTPSRRQNQKILDRWAAHQAREMVTTIERQAHEAEISALSNVSQPVSQRAQCFLHRREKGAQISALSNASQPVAQRAQCFKKEASPTPSDMSVVSAPGADVLQTVRASSLIQMWRDLEGSTPRGGDGEKLAMRSWPEENGENGGVVRGKESGNGGMVQGKESENGVMVRGKESENGVVVRGNESENGVVMRGKESGNGVTVRAVVRGRGEIEELVARMEAERKRELCFISERRAVSQFQYRGRLQAILRLRFLRKEVPDWDIKQVPPVRAKPDQLKIKYLAKTQSGKKVFATRQNLKCEVQGCNNPVTSDESCTNSNIDPTVDSTADSNQTLKRKEEHESPKTKPEEFMQPQQEEVDETPSPNGNKNTDQNQQDERNTHQANAATLCINDNIFQIDGVPISTNDNIHGADVAPILSNNNTHPADTETVNTIQPQKEHSPVANEAMLTKTNIHQDQDIINIQTQDLTNPITKYEPDPDMLRDDRDLAETESSCSEQKSPSYTNNDDRIEEENMSGVSRSLDSSWDERNLWLGSVDWQRSVEPTTPNSWRGDVVPVEDLGAFPWSCDSPNSWRALVFRDVFENISDNVEIRDLLERRRVTTTLESDFCAKMNRMILSLLQKQGQYNNVGDNFEEEFEAKPYWRLNYELRNTDPVPSASSSLVPFNYHNNTDNNWHATTFTHNLQPQNSVDVGSVNQLRSDISQIHDEISELRKLVESCVQWQVKLQNSIKNEVTNAVFQAVGSPTHSSNCCICKQMQVNSLLYRCGHMCACFKCAQNLQSNGQKCPICQSPIKDVVRVNPES